MALLVLWVAWPFLGTAGYPVSVDTVLYSGPNHVVNLEAWRHLRAPFWDAGIFGGVPQLANQQAGSLYPLKLLVLPFGAARGMGLLVALHLSLFAFGLWYVARRSLGLLAPAGFVAAAVGVAGGMAMMKSLQFEQLLVLCLAPLLMAAIDAVLAAPRPWLPMAAVAVLTAGLLTAGHPQIVYVLAPLVVVWLVARTLDRASARRLLHVAAAGGVGLLLAAVQLVPTIGLTARTEATKTQRTVEQLSDPSYVLDPALIPVTLLGDLTSDRPLALSGTSEAASFVGAAAVTLALLGLGAAVLGRRRRWTAALLAVAAVVGVLFALGPWFHPYRWLLDVVPGFRLARVPARWLVVWGIATAVLAGIGSDALSRRRVDRRVVAVAAGAFAVAAVAVVAGPAGIPPLRLLAPWVLAAGLVALAPGLAGAPGRWATVALLLPAVVVGVELGTPSGRSEARLLRQPVAFESYTSNVVEALEGRSGKVLTMTFDRFDAPAYLVGAMRPNANVIAGISSIDGYDGGLQVTRRWSAMADSFSAKPFDRDLPLRNQIALPLDAEHLARLGVRWALIETQVLLPDQQVPGWGGPVAVDGTVQLWENPAYLGEARWYPATMAAPDAETAARLSATATATGAAVVEPNGPTLTCSVRCDVRGYEPDRPRAGSLSVSTDEPVAGVLALPEQVDPGWTATIDGAGVDVVPVDGFLAGVVVPAGRHTVMLSYRPDTWPVAIVLSLLGLAGLVALVVLGLRGRPDARGDAGPADAGPGAATGPRGDDVVDEPVPVTSVLGDPLLR